MARIAAANDKDHATSADDFAIFADSLDAGSDLHLILSHFWATTSGET